MSFGLLTADAFQLCAQAAADLMVCVDDNGRILEAAGDAPLLNHPTPDRLVGRNVFALMAGDAAPDLKKRIWSLAPGRRLSWDEEGDIEGGRRVLIRRNDAGGGFAILLTRLPLLARFHGETLTDTLADRFREAVTSGRLRVALQPVVLTHSGEISHFEMLARFDDDASPAELITAAERTGQISQLDYLMVKAAVERLAADDNIDLRLAVNVSGASVQRPDVINELCAIISAHAFRRDRLIIEVTESAKITDMETAAVGVSRLRRCGVGVSLDDFGAGASSLGYLRQLEVNGLKFDGCFLASPLSSERGLTVMRSVARLCSELGIASVGERVETEDHRRQLLAAGVRYAQGYLFGAPRIDDRFFNGGVRGCAA